MTGNVSGLSAQIELSRATFELSVAFDVPEASVLAILGPNGSGKSTVLGCLAGLVFGHTAMITLDGRTLTDATTRVPAHERGVGLLSQDSLLFPHLSVMDNVAFGPRARGAGKAHARELATRWLAEVDAGELVERRPAQLSGGQAQRVALARALASEPTLLLLDEPFAALDVEAAPAIRGLVRRELRGRSKPSVLVTHNPLDALALSDEVLVLAEGRVVERGPTRTVLAAPKTRFTARIAGLNLVTGTAVEQGIRTPNGEVISGVLAEETTVGEPAVAVFGPGEVAVYPPDASVEGSPRNSVRAVVTALEPHGAMVRIRLGGEAGAASWVAGLAAELTPAAVAELELEVGTPVRVTIKAAAISVHPALST